MSPRLRSWAWPVARVAAINAPLIIIFAAFEVPVVLIERRLGGRLQLDVRPASMILFFWALAYGVLRALMVHPVYRRDYRAWLEMTPWTWRQPLPLGPIELSWEDGISLGVLIGLAGLLPEPRAPQLLCTALLMNLLTLTPALWATGCQGLGYAVLFGLGFAVRLWYRPSACLAALAVVYAIAYEGLWRSMARFPSGWPKIASRKGGGSDRTRPRCGWPHDRMLADLIDVRDVRAADAALASLLAVWGLDAVISLIPDPPGQFTAAADAFVCGVMACVFGRLIIYVNGYHSPLSLWARIRTGRWVIPGYDQVFVGPACSLLAAAATAVLLQACRVPPPTSLTSGAGMALLAALITPPDLRRWRLTGQHRIVPPLGGGSTNDAGSLVQVK